MKANSLYPSDGGLRANTTAINGEEYPTPYLLLPTPIQVHSADLDGNSITNSAPSPGLELQYNLPKCFSIIL